MSLTCKRVFVGFSRRKIIVDFAKVNLQVLDGILPSNIYSKFYLNY